MIKKENSVDYSFEYDILKMEDCYVLCYKDGGMFHVETTTFSDSCIGDGIFYVAGSGIGRRCTRNRNHDRTGYRTCDRAGYRT